MLTAVIASTSVKTRQQDLDVELELQAAAASRAELGGNGGGSEAGGLNGVGEDVDDAFADASSGASDVGNAGHAAALEIGAVREAERAQQLWNEEHARKQVWVGGWVGRREDCLRQ